MQIAIAYRKLFLLESALRLFAGKIGDTPASVLALSVFASQIHLSQRERPWHGVKVYGSSAKLAVSPEALPLGELSPQVTERARTVKCANTVPSCDPTREKGTPERPQTLRCSEIIKHCRASGISFCAQRKHHCISTSLPQALRLTAHPGCGYTRPWKHNGRGYARPSDGWWKARWGRTAPPTG